MRLAATLTDRNEALQLSEELRRHRIDNSLEFRRDDDWGSHDYGTVTIQLWVHEEDQLAQAMQLIAEWHRHRVTLPTVPTVAEKADLILEDDEQALALKQPMGFATFYLLAICIALFVYGVATEPDIKPPLPKLPILPLAMPPIKKDLLYDYPKAYELVDALEKEYGYTALQSPELLPRQGREAFLSARKTPIWEGVYPLALAYASGRTPNPLDQGPLFESIRSQGEVWRLFTPIVIHGDFFHLLFNMLWLITLGKQLEQRLGLGRYLLFVGIVALASNTGQYIMSGANFLGFSGVLCGMLAFIWQRQKYAPWEGYQLDGSTLKLLFAFIGIMASLQLLFFIGELLSGHEFSIGLANTAHLVGLAAGFLLARFKAFSLKI